MMDSLDKGFRKEFRKFVRSDESFEHEIVQTIISHYKLTTFKKELMHPDTGMYRLGVFLSRFPQFPVYLFCSYIPGLTKTEMVAKLFNNFERCPFVSTYKEIVETQLPEELSNHPTGLVFNYPRVPHGLVIHSKAIDPLKPGCRMIFSNKNLTLTLQPFASLLEDVGDGWIK